MNNYLLLLLLQAFQVLFLWVHNSARPIERRRRRPNGTLCTRVTTASRASPSAFISARGASPTLTPLGSELTYGLATACSSWGNSALGGCPISSKRNRNARSAFKECSAKRILCRYATVSFPTPPKSCCIWRPPPRSSFFSSLDKQEMTTDCRSSSALRCFVS
jgi:hypothetical protein